MKVRLILEVDYDPQGTPVEELHGNLKNIAEYAVDTDMLAGGTDAEVIDYTITVETVDEAPEAL